MRRHNERCRCEQCQVWDAIDDLNRRFNHLLKQVSTNDERITALKSVPDPEFDWGRVELGPPITIPYSSIEDDTKPETVSLKDLERQACVEYQARIDDGERPKLQHLLDEARETYERIKKKPLPGVSPPKSGQGMSLLEEVNRDLQERVRWHQEQAAAYRAANEEDRPSYRDSLKCPCPSEMKPGEQWMLMYNENGDRFYRIFDAPKTDDEPVQPTIVEGSP